MLMGVPARLRQQEGSSKVVTHTHVSRPPRWDPGRPLPMMALQRALAATQSHDGGASSLLTVASVPRMDALPPM